MLKIKFLGKGIKLNVTDNEQISNEVKKYSDEDFGSVDILVNNAGITRDNILLRMKEDEWEDIINTNLSSIYKMSKSVLRGMIKKRSGQNYFYHLSCWRYGKCWTIKLCSSKSRDYRFY